MKVLPQMRLSRWSRTPLAKGLSYKTHTLDGRMTSVNSIGLQIWENPTIEIFEIGDDGVLLEMAVNPYGYVINFQE